MSPYALVVYDSVYGNTAQVAEAIGRGITQALGAGQEVELRRVGDLSPADLASIRLLVVGSPTHGGRPTPATKRLLKSVPRQALEAVRVAAFDTRIDEESLQDRSALFIWFVHVLGYAAAPIARLLQKKGGHLAAPPEGFIVGDREGPLREGEPARAEAWGKALVSA